VPRLDPAAQEDLLEQGVPAYLIDAVETRAGVPQPPPDDPAILEEAIRQALCNLGLPDDKIQLALDAIAGRVAGHEPLWVLEMRAEQLKNQKAQAAIRERKRKQRLEERFLVDPPAEHRLIPPPMPVVPDVPGSLSTDPIARRREQERLRQNRHRERLRSALP
jgi:hypothetical protein